MKTVTTKHSRTTDPRHALPTSFDTGWSHWRFPRSCWRMSFQLQARFIAENSHVFVPTTSFTIFKIANVCREKINHLPFLIRIPLNRKTSKLRPFPTIQVCVREFQVQANVFERARTSKCSNVAKGTSLSRRSWKKYSHSLKRRRR